MVNPINCSSQSLPISVDLTISVEKRQVVTTIDLSTIVFIMSTGPLNQGAGRIQYYDDLASIGLEWGTTSEAYIAGQAFFSQPDRPETFSVAQAFSTPQPALLFTGATGTLAAFQAITDGGFTIELNGNQAEINSLDFSSDTSLDDVAATIQAGLNAEAGAEYTGATVVASNAPSNQFTITNGTSGDSSTITVLSAPTSGTDISGIGFMNGQDAVLVQGYTPTTFTNELILIQEAASCSDRFVFAWALEKVYRDTQDQLDLAAFTAANDFLAVSFLQTNNILTLDPNDTTDNASLLAADNNITSNITYNDTPTKDQYPEVAIAARFLGVDYDGADTALTGKFKNLNEINTTPLTVTEYRVLEGKRCNAFTQMDNSARTYRDGVQSSSSWYIDDYINISNFLNELRTSIYNVFTTSKKVPYTPSGILKLSQSETNVCAKYVFNDVLADRTITNLQKPNGVETIPAYQVIFPPLSQITQSERDTRVLMGNKIFLQLSGAIHTLSVSVVVTE